MAAAPHTPGDPAPSGRILQGHKAYVLLVLSLVYTFNYIDRQALIILAEPIKAEFGLKDWHLGFLTGTAFALFYATLSIPVARLADRWHRVNIIAIALAIWSAMTALCAASANFIQLAAARFGVGAGEAGGSPPAVSILSDYFPESQRATAMGIYSLGFTVGILIGFGLVGWLNQLYGWRTALLAVGLPGVLLSLIVKKTVREPQRKLDAAQALPFARTLRALMSITTFSRLNLASIAAAFSLYGVMVWMPSYLFREFGWSTAQVGTALGLISGVAGSAGVFLGGVVADALGRKDRRWRLWLPALTTLLFVPCVLLAVNADSVGRTLALLVPAYALAFAYTGPTWAVLQSVTPTHMRALAAAVLLFFGNLIGLGLGPQAIGIMSDLSHAGGGAGLRAAIEIVAAVSALASVSFYFAGKTVSADTERVS